MALIKGQAYTPQEIYDQDPNWLKQNQPQLYENITKGLTIPTSQAQSGQANAAVDTATVNPKINSVTATSQLDVNKAAQQDALVQAGAYFEGHKGKDGKVSPQDYNQERAKYVGLGGNGTDFEARFQDQYVNPNNLWYDTPDNVATRHTLPQVVNLIKTYGGLKHSGPGTLTTLKSIPFVKGNPDLENYLQQKILGPEIAYNSNKSQQSAELLKTVGAGPGQQVRGSMAELANAVGGLPDAFDDDTTAEAKINDFNNFLQAAYGTNLKEWGISPQ